MDSVNSVFSQSFVFSLNVLGRLLILLIDVIFFSQSLRPVTVIIKQAITIPTCYSLHVLRALFNC